VNLSYVHKLLVAADQQRHGFLRIRGRQADHEVRLMADAGLVDATLSDGKDESFTAIKRLTDLGRTFLRTFKDLPIPALALLPPRTRTALEWHGRAFLPVNDA
jgi:hypothetical protein